MLVLSVMAIVFVFGVILTTGFVLTAKPTDYLSYRLMTGVVFTVLSTVLSGAVTMAGIEIDKNNDETNRDRAYCASQKGYIAEYVLCIVNDKPIKFEDGHYTIGQH